MAYHVGTHPQTFKTSREAVAYAASIVATTEHHQCLIWDRPFHGVATVRHNPQSGDTLIHRYNRDGRELPGDRI